MDKQYTVAEIRVVASRSTGDVGKLLHDYANLLEAQERAVPMMVVNHVSSAEHDLPIGMKLYTQPPAAGVAELLTGDLNEVSLGRDTYKAKYEAMRERTEKAEAELGALMARMKPCARVEGGEVRVFMDRDDEGKHVAVLVVED